MDVLKVNTSRKAFEKASGKDFPEIGKLKDGVNHFRIIAGPQKVETIWYPTMIEREGKMQQTVRTVVRPAEGCILDNLVKLDEDLTKKAMVSEGLDQDTVKKYRSALRPQRAFRFLVFDRTADNEGKPTVRIYDFPYTVKDQLEALQNTVSQKNKGFLEYGLIFMYDVYVTREKNESIKNLQHSIDYKTAVVQDTTPLFVKKQHVPISHLDWDSESGAPCPWNYEDYFTPEELEAIAEYDKDLGTLCKPDTEEEITEKLKKNPIYLDAKFLWGDRKGDKMFPIFTFPENRQLLMESVQSTEVKLISDSPSEGTAEVDAEDESVPVPAPIKPVSLRERLGQKVEPKEEVREVEPTSTAPQPSTPVAPAASPMKKKLWTK